MDVFTILVLIKRWLELMPIDKFFSTKNIDSLTSNRHNSFQNSNDRKATQNFALSPPFLSCNNKV